MNCLLEPAQILRNKWHVTVESLFCQWIRLSPTYSGARNRVGVAQRRGSVWRHLEASGRRAGHRNLNVPPSPLLLLPLDVYHCDGNIPGYSRRASDLSHSHSGISFSLHDDLH